MNTNEENVKIHKIDLRKNLSLGRLLWLGIMSVFLCYSFIMSIFAPFPLILAFLGYGRKKAVALCALSLIATIFLSLALPEMLFFTGFYLLAVLIAVTVSEIILRDINPLKGLINGGVGICLIIVAFFGSLVISVEGPIEDHLINVYSTEYLPKLKEQADKILVKGGELEQVQLNLLMNPKKLVRSLLIDVPFALASMVFFFLWTHLLMTIRGQKILLMESKYSFSDSELLSFKVKDFVLMLFIGLLSLVVYLAWYKETSALYTICLNILMFGFGLLFFFQGFGVFIALLDKLKIYGLMRTVLVVLSIIFPFGRWMIALIGLFDNWLDFSQKINNKENSEV